MQTQSSNRWWRRASIGVAVAAASAAATIGVAAPAHAALPDRFGFVLWNGAAPVASGTSPVGTTVAPLGVGRYMIRFPGQGIAGGVVHITAINDGPHWCQVDKWGQSGVDEIVYASCYKAGGALDNSSFSAVFDRSSGVSTTSARFGYVDALGTGVINDQFNSSGGLNTVGHLGVGQYVVKLPGLGTPGPTDGGVQVTAVNPNVGARCKVWKWISTTPQQEVNVLCFNPAGALTDNRFTLTFQFQRALTGGAFPPKYFGYLWNTPPLGPISTNFNSVVGSGANTITPAGVGLSLVRFPKLSMTPNTVHVTAAGANSNFCGLNTFWATTSAELVVRDVNCFTNAGVPVNTGFTISTTASI